MAYKHERKVIEALDTIYEVMGAETHAKVEREITEVYHKAESFNEMILAYNYNPDSDSFGVVAEEILFQAERNDYE